MTEQENKIVAELRAEKAKLLSIIESIDRVIRTYTKEKDKPEKYINPNFPYDYHFRNRVRWILENHIQGKITPSILALKYNYLTKESEPSYKFGYHLKAFAKEGFLKSVGEGRNRHYTINKPKP